jgi:hypothetical protein
MGCQSCSLSLDDGLGMICYDLGNDGCRVLDNIADDPVVPGRQVIFVSFS